MVAGSGKTMRLGLVGYGVGGRLFHAPFIAAAEGVELAGVVTRDPVRREELSRQFPGVPAYDSLKAMADGERVRGGIDAVTITTPPQTRRELVLEALAHNFHVVADKPFAPDAAGAIELSDAAASAGRLLAVYHNRRWDSDMQTLRALLDAGQLGAVERYHSTMDQDSLDTLEAGPSGGLLRDLGSHLVDQALWSFGPVTKVYASLEWAGADADRTDVGFLLVLTHHAGTTSVLSATKRNHLDSRELRVYGELGSYLASSTDVQAQALFDGKRPTDDPDRWGLEPRSSWGTLRTAAAVTTVPSEQGTYTAFYESFGEAIRTGSPLPVSAQEGIDVLEVLDAARASDAASSIITLRTEDAEIYVGQASRP